MRVRSDFKAFLLESIDIQKMGVKSYRRAFSQASPKAERKRKSKAEENGKADSAAEDPKEKITVTPSDAVFLEEKEEEEEWMFDCSCEVKGKNYDDKLPMIQCEKCLSWVHKACFQVGEYESPERFYCHQCGESDWMMFCICGVKEKNYNDNAQMIEWHTACLRRSGHENAPANEYVCFNCVARIGIR